MSASTVNNKESKIWKFTEVQKGLLLFAAKVELEIASQAKKTAETSETSESSDSSDTDSPVVSAPVEIEKGGKELLKMYEKYAKFLHRLRKVEIEDTVFVHCSIMFKKVMKKRQKNLKQKDALKVFAACLYLSFKYVVDDLLFYVEDYARLTGINQKLVEILEVAIVVNILAFDMNYKAEDYKLERANLEAVGSSLD